MRSTLLVAFVVSFTAVPAVVDAATPRESLKTKTVAALDKHQAELIDLSDKVWSFAETALRETRSSALLADYAQQQGFQVTRGVADLPTAFTATFGSGSPIIGIMGEYDALPGLSQKAQPSREAMQSGAPGHGCGHNMFGAASMGAAVAIKEMIQSGSLKGTVRFYGTPAEEAVGGKVYMARAGLFSDLDVVLAWHPDSVTKADTSSSQALVDLVVEFKGKAAHAAFDPWNGRSAVDAMELFTHGINMLREHVRPTVRMHYTIQKGGDVPNVVPEYARLWLWLRDRKRAGVEEVLLRVRDAAEGAARMAGVDLKFTVQGGDYEILVNEQGARLLHENLLWLGPLTYTDPEQQFARALQKATGVDPTGMDGSIHSWDERDEEGGSTDVGDVSWVVPTLHLSVATAPAKTPWHAWPVVAAGGMSIGHKGMMHASRTLAATMVDLFEDAETRAAIRREFDDKTRGQVYKPYIPDGPPPAPPN
ncbi:MAG: amidohydrolase [Candidatus Polarisedimenticolia bacterium]